MDLIVTVEAKVEISELDESVIVELALTESVADVPSHGTHDAGRYTASITISPVARAARSAPGRPTAKACNESIRDVLSKRN